MVHAGGVAGLADGYAHNDGVERQLRNKRRIATGCRLDRASQCLPSHTSRPRSAVQRGIWEIYLQQGPSGVGLCHGLLDLSGTKPLVAQLIGSISGVGAP